jgi:hypothetical protein
MAARLRASAREPANPAKQLRTRVRNAITALLTVESIEQAGHSVDVMEWGTRYSRNACVWLVDGGVFGALIACMRKCKRSVHHQALLLKIIAVLDNMLMHGEAAVPIEPRALADFMHPLTDILQYFRCGNCLLCIEYLPQEPFGHTSPDTGIGM